MDAKSRRRPTNSLLVYDTWNSDLIGIARVGDYRRFFNLDAFGLPAIGSDRFYVNRSQALLRRTGAR